MNTLRLPGTPEDCTDLPRPLLVSLTGRNASSSGTALMRVVGRSRAARAGGRAPVEVAAFQSSV
jgi:hypothetical protein